VNDLGRGAGAGDAEQIVFVGVFDDADVGVRRDDDLRAGAPRTVPAAIVTFCAVYFLAKRAMRSSASGVVSVTSRMRMPFAVNASATASAASTDSSRTTPTICSIATFSNSALRDMDADYVIPAVPLSAVSYAGVGCRESGVGAMQDTDPRLPTPDTHIGKSRRLRPWSSSTKRSTR
jgi:hypothetical protein